MKKYILLFCTFLFAFASTNAQIQNLQSYFTKTDNFLAANVKNGNVNYKNIQAKKMQLDELVTFVAKQQSFTSTNEEKAFYLNSYNLTVIKAITDAYPIKGPMDIPGFFDKKKYTVNGNSITLNGIENDIVRKKYNDARIHFALVCGAKSCPPLPSYAFSPKNLNAQLDLLTKQSIQNPTFTKIDVKNNKASVSMLFNWYKDDFIKAKGSIIGFLNAYLKVPVPANISLENYTYNWALNGD
ncbi:MAG: DUF547 domain-containing protein [Ferruginibacter sp.]